MSRSRSCRYHDEKGRYEINVGKHSFRKARSGSSPFPVTKHKRRTRVDELQ
jgi:hypothetical protein